MNKPKVGKPKTLNFVSLSRRLPALRLPKSAPPVVAGRPRPKTAPPRKK